MWPGVLAALVMSANVRIIFDNATEASDVGLPPSFNARLVYGKSYECTTGGEGQLSCAWQSGLSLRYNSNEFNTIAS